MYHEKGYTLVHKHVYRVYSTVLGLQFACTCNPNLACTLLTCMRASCTCLVHTRELCTVNLTSPILHAHAGLHTCEMKKCCVMPLLHAYSIKFKLICTVYTYIDTKLYTLLHVFTYRKVTKRERTG